MIHAANCDAHRGKKSFCDQKWLPVEVKTKKDYKEQREY